jgi:hypothetical protein
LKLILNKVRNYIDGNTFNVRAGRIVASLCFSLTSSNKFGKVAFGIFFDYVYQNLSKIKSTKHYDDFLTTERGDIEVTWNLQLFAELMNTNGEILSSYMKRIEEIIDWYRPTIHKESYIYLCNASRNVVTSLTNIYPREMCSVTYDLTFDNENDFFKDHLPIRDWAKTADLFNLKIDYHIPSVVEIGEATDFVAKMLDQSMDFLRQSITTHKMTTTSKEERNREFTFINNLIYASSRLLKRTQRLKIKMKTATVSDIEIPDDINKGLGFENCLVDGDGGGHEYAQLTPKQKLILKTLRGRVVEFCLEMNDKLTELNTNETILFSLIFRILSTASMTYGLFVDDFEKRWKNYYTIKASMQNKLLDKKGSLRNELIRRVMLQYDFRTFHLYDKLNDLDYKTIECLFKQSKDSAYAVVRKSAQTQLFVMLSHYPMSWEHVLPKLIESLSKTSVNTPQDQQLTHDQLKGCLYILRGNIMSESFVLKKYWQALCSIWPVLLKCQSYEKPSIQTLLDKFYDKTSRSFDSFDNSTKLTNDTIELCFQMNSNLGFGINDPKRLEQFEITSQCQRLMVGQLIGTLVKISGESQQFAWKNQVNSYGSLLYLFDICSRNKSLLTSQVVRLFVDALVHENHAIRRIALDTMCIILKMTKYPKQVKKTKTANLILSESKIKPNRIVINEAAPGYRSDNKWSCYDSSFLTNMDRNKWENTSFIDKAYVGYYCWPNEIEINSNRRQFYNYEESSQGELSFEKFLNVF